jgi:hypothetical protein
LLALLVCSFWSDVCVHLNPLKIRRPPRLVLIFQPHPPWVLWPDPARVSFELHELVRSLRRVSNYP